MSTRRYRVSESLSAWVVGTDRNGRRGFLAPAILIAAAAFFDGATSCSAEPSIGAAETVINLVKGRLASRAEVLVSQGDGVYRDEDVRTNEDSSAKLVLRDNTALSIGPSSSVKLDRFVYAGEGQGGAIAVNVIKGALVFATGNANKKSYQITTPTAAIGVRGTIFKVVATASKTIVELEEGAVVVCMRRANTALCRPGSSRRTSLRDRGANRRSRQRFGRRRSCPRKRYWGRGRPGRRRRPRRRRRRRRRRRGWGRRRRRRRGRGQRRGVKPPKICERPFGPASSFEEA